jgi:hypothetical protein
MIIFIGGKNVFRIVARKRRNAMLCATTIRPATGLVVCELP